MMAMIFRIFLMGLLASVVGVGQERAPAEPKSLPAPDQAVEPVKPPIVRLDGERYRIGDKIEFNQRTREIRFPAAVNMNEGLLEYAVVHERGKIHESLLVTGISATQLNIALALLRYKPSPELYAIPNERGGLTDRFPEVAEEVKAAARLEIKVEWEDGGRKRVVPLEQWIQHAVKGSAMPATLWVYGGSEVHEGKFVPESTGELIAIFITNSSLFNYPGEDNRDDTVWLPYPKRVPEPGTPVTVILGPNPALKPPPAAGKPAGGAGTGAGGKTGDSAKPSDKK